jgi:predicted DNA-binding protein
VTTLFSFGACANDACDVNDMSKKRKDSTMSIRLRIEKEILDRIDQLAGEKGRQRFIHEAILWRLDEELPPMMLDLIRDVDDLKARVTFLESSKSGSMHLSELNDIARNELCLDEIDCKLLVYFIKNEGATTPELAENILGSRSKRRTILDRIDRMNERAKHLFGSIILKYQKGLVNNKRGAWWITNLELVVI